MRLRCRASTRARRSRQTAPMSRHRLHIDQPISPDHDIEITGERAHYLSRVLRLKIGSRLSVFADDSDEHAAVITALGKNRVTLSIGDATGNDTESPLRVRLLQGISRSERMDFAVQKATELGVDEVQPLHTEFSVVKLDAARAARRVAHWQKVARAACEQSGRTRVPRVAEPQSLLDCLPQPSDADCRIVLLPGSKTPFEELPAGVTAVDLLVGPEGGFSERETAEAAACGFVAVAAGPRILRSETAALVAVTLAQARWGDLQDA